MEQSQTRPESLLESIERFCERHKMPISTFGRLSTGDGSFVPDLRSGRRVWPETEAKVRDFMAARDAAESAAA